MSNLMFYLFLIRYAKQSKIWFSLMKIEQSVNRSNLYIHTHMRVYGTHINEKVRIVYVRNRSDLNCTFNFSIKCNTFTMS